MKFLQKFRKGRKGFTLIELLVVIAILGVIAAVAVPNILKFMDSGAEEAARAEQHNVQVAVAAWMVDNTGSPADAITPTDKGLFAAYLINNVEYNWTIDANGAVTPTDSTNPLYVAP
ncbi:type II secretion system protein [Dehalogenimonas etheniformans]|uniref:Prepilin-type N-terminal cleavage/methylation domain-containing protein n=1 Tax=Dehalogenimonas etheniformans TaxID=1536648 RepID=A0A2P5P8K3_9CHLR|nr:prepilin-type N-terminal cleavage/methylation domain-containing protein [Dehalogenimonas etheniformans]PPD58619.1 prepilin-type N-terminal cleavage/methylation domain-containing protein [Dehalogenimonas etheniformans]QNT76614.1 prepilin-type N-terminal cleavage/methylation domain-containing protein [Dehalogenimonas etheniformans]